MYYHTNILKIPVMRYIQCFNEMSNYHAVWKQIDDSLQESIVKRNISKGHIANIQI